MPSNSSTPVCSTALGAASRRARARFKTSSPLGVGCAPMVAAATTSASACMSDASCAMRAVSSASMPERPTGMALNAPPSTNCVAKATRISAASMSVKPYCSGKPALAATPPAVKRRTAESSLVSGLAAPRAALLTKLPTTSPVPKNGSSAARTRSMGNWVPALTRPAESAARVRVATHAPRPAPTTAPNPSDAMLSGDKNDDMTDAVTAPTPPFCRRL